MHGQVSKATEGKFRIMGGCAMDKDAASSRTSEAASRFVELTSIGQIGDEYIVNLPTCGSWVSRDLEFIFCSLLGGGMCGLCYTILLLRAFLVGRDPLL